MAQDGFVLTEEEVVELEKDEDGEGDRTES